ncbi:Uncharacterized protein Adt_48237 [Abeliophyllum distichum]|uniref:RNase H type-1 domain-containing protein n=1 Tax=Abeliophyllum distichum TaxID=126358 RepID=A0ABD1NRM4_9LAMI
MASYLKLVRDLIPCFDKFELIQVPRVDNANADALSKLVSSKDTKLLKIIPIEHLVRPFIEAVVEVMWVEKTSTLMDPILAFLKDQSVPANREGAKKIEEESSTLRAI